MHRPQAKNLLSILLTIIINACWINTCGFWAPVMAAPVPIESAPQITEPSAGGEPEKAKSEVPNLPKETKPDATAGTLHDSNFHAHVTSHTKFQQPSPDKIVLTSGELLIDTLRAGVVVMPKTQVYVRPGVVVLCQVMRGVEYIFVLSDNSPKSTSLIFNKHNIRLDQGSEAIVADHKLQYQEMAGQDDIGHRAMRMHMLDNDYCLVTTEFSVLGAVQLNKMLASITHSDDPNDKDLTTRLLKTGAALSTLTGSRGPYSRSNH